MTLNSVSNDSFLNSLHQTVQKFSVLKHSFYQAWSKGELTKDHLKNYAQEYFSHVNAFPQYISKLHSICPTNSGRQLLLSHLIEEESGTENHPELWCRFAEELGAERTVLNTSHPSDAAQQLVDKFRQLCGEDFATGLGALYAYESQVPEVAEVKIEGLKKFYGIESTNGLAFFNVHRTADVYHREQIANELSHLTDTEKQRALKGAQLGAQAVWDFLSSLPPTSENCNLNEKCH